MLFPWNWIKCFSFRSSLRYSPNNKQFPKNAFYLPYTQWYDSDVRTCKVKYACTLNIQTIGHFIKKYDFCGAHFSFDKCFTNDFQRYSQKRNYFLKYKTLCSAQNTEYILCLTIFFIGDYLNIIHECCAKPLFCSHFPWRTKFKIPKNQECRTMNEVMKNLFSTKCKTILDQLRGELSILHRQSIDLNWTQLISLIDRFFFV